ncbi:MAG TPA: hypothetical protein VMT93_03935, partial [Gemmatimonadaceae bacterium]|nr:hypothetical protein [Gemmatimonadaceae bacterium]
FAGVVCAAVFAALAWAAATDPPFARVAAIPRDGAGLAPAWQMPWTPAARALALGVAALLVIVAACRAARLPARGWTLAAMTVGACAIAAAMRRGLTGPPIGFLEGGLLAVSLVVPVAARRDLLGARAWRVLAAALAAAGIALAAGAAWGARAALPLGGTAPATARGPAGATWTFTSDGLSVYEEQNRHVTAVLVDVRRGSSRVGVARAEWRDYLGASGETLGDGAPYDAVLAAPFTYTTVGLAMPPAGEDVVLDVRFAPLFWLWWLFAALAAAAAAIAAAGPAAVASRGEAG